MSDCDSSSARKVGRSTQGRGGSGSSQAAFVLKATSPASETSETSLQEQRSRPSCETQRSTEVAHILLYREKSANSLRPKSPCGGFASIFVDILLLPPFSLLSQLSLERSCCLQTLAQKPFVYFIYSAFASRHLVLKVLPRRYKYIYYSKFLIEESRSQDQRHHSRF